jgi:hypothetical protein
MPSGFMGRNTSKNRTARPGEADAAFVVNNVNGQILDLQSANNSFGTGTKFIFICFHSIRRLTVDVLFRKTNRKHDCLQGI